MKKNVKRIFLILLIIVGMTAGSMYYNYRQTMDNITIVHYFNSKSNNLDYQSIYIRAVLPMKDYHGVITMNAIRIYVIIRSKNIPNNIEIVLYDNMEKFGDCDGYATIIFRK